jgi:outer membrane protein insertion porin family
VSKKKFKEDFTQVMNLYYDSGYVTTQINSREKVDEGKREISFEVVIVEGDRSHIGRIIIQGNTKTKEFVIRRELPFEEGDIFSRAKIQKGYINLMRTGYFSRNLMFEPAQGSQEGLIDLIITVSETSTAQFELGGSIIPSDFPFSAYANLYDKNFLGLGITSGLNLNVTPLEQSLAVFYENGWFFGKRILGGVSLSFKHAIIQNVPQDILGPIFNGDEPDAAPDPFSSYSEYEAALESGEGIPTQYTMQYHSLAFQLALTGGYSIDLPIGLFGMKIEPSTSLSYVTWDPSIHRPFSNLLRSELNQWVLINCLGFTVSLSATDIPQNPETGYYFSQYVGFTGAFLAGSRSYTRLSTEAEFYIKFFDIPVSDTGHFKLILALHSQLSLLVPPIFGSEVSVEDDYYRIDGLFVGRGWNLRQRGKVLWDNKIELRMPLVEEALWWTVAFFDIDGLWLQPQDFAAMKDSDFYFGFGTGLRLTIPGVPLRLYLAKRFRVVNGVVEWQEGTLKFWEGFNLDIVFSIDINPF